MNPAANSAAVIAAAEERLRSEWTAVRAIRLQSIDAYLAFGRALIQEKRAVPHGEWLPVLQRIGIHKRTAARAMKLARLGLKKDVVSSLGGVSAVLSLPPAIVEIVKSDPEAAAELAKIKQQLADAAFAVAEAQEQTRAHVDRLLASVAKLRRGIEAHRANGWTAEAELSSIEAECNEWEAQARDSLERIESNDHD